MQSNHQKEWQVLHKILTILLYVSFGLTFIFIEFTDHFDLAIVTMVLTMVVAYTFIIAGVKAKGRKLFTFDPETSTFDKVLRTAQIVIGSIGLLYALWFIIVYVVPLM